MEDTPEYLRNDLPQPETLAPALLAREHSVELSDTVRTSKKYSFENPPPHINYILAQAKVLKIERKVRALAAKGNHHSKNITINSELRNATMARNALAKQVMEELDIVATFQEETEHRYTGK